MAKVLPDAVARIQAIVGGLTGVRGAPDSPPDSLPSTWPYAVCYPGRGEISAIEATTNVEIHTIILELHHGHQELARVVSTIAPYVRNINIALWNDVTLDNTVDTIQAIRYTFGLLGWGETDAQTLGIRFEIDVKIRVTTNVTRGT